MKTRTMDSAGAMTGALEHLGAELRRFFAAMAAGAQASREYDRLSRASDAALAREGLTRAEIGQAVVKRHLR